MIVLDEAGAVGIDDMKRLFELAKECRLILSGDTGQHASVARGDALRILEQHSSLQSGQLTRIRRQRRAEYRRAVELAAQKRTIEAFAQLERMGAIAQFAGDELHVAAAQAYLKTLKARESALVVAPTWTEIEAVTERVRDALKAQGLISEPEHPFRVFDSLSWTQAQKRDTRQFRPGMTLRFHQARGGFARCESVEVIAVGSGEITIRCADGSTKQPNLPQISAAFDVGETRTLNVAAGDRLLLRANAGRKQFVNGELVAVKAVHGEDILLTDGRIIPRDYRAFTHGYAVTSHAAQGKTADEILVVASSRSLPAVHQQQFYVSISRGRERCQVFTDDKDLLRSRVTHSSERLAAVDVVSHTHRRDFIRRVMQRGHRFLKHFRQRLTQSHSFREGTEQLRKSYYEHQHRPRRSIRV